MRIHYPSYVSYERIEINLTLDRNEVTNEINLVFEKFKFIQARIRLELLDTKIQSFHTCLTELWMDSQLT